MAMGMATRASRRRSGVEANPPEGRPRDGVVITASSNSTSLHAPHAGIYGRQSWPGNSWAHEPKVQTHRHGDALRILCQVVMAACAPPDMSAGSSVATAASRPGQPGAQHCRAGSVGRPSALPPLPPLHSVLMRTGR